MRKETATGVPLGEQRQTREATDTRRLLISSVNTIYTHKAPRRLI